MKIPNIKSKVFLQPGYSLFEVVIYVGFVLSLGLSISALTIQLMRVHTHAQVTQEVLVNARGAMDTMMQEVRHAESLYTPTSNLNTSAPTLGQLSLETTRNAPTGHTTGYVDFYVDDGRLYVQRDGQSAELLTSERIIVEDFVIQHLNQSSGAPLIRIALTMRHETEVTSLSVQPTVTLFSTAAIRVS